MMGEPLQQESGGYASPTSIEERSSEQTQSKFFQLPTEIRLEIYAYSLTASNGVALRLPEIWLDSEATALHSRPCQHCYHHKQRVYVTLINLGLLRVCKRIHQEAMLVFYDRNVFHYYKPLYIFLRHSTENRFRKSLPFIRHLRVSYLGGFLFGLDREQCIIHEGASKLTGFEFIINHIPRLKTFTIVFRCRLEGASFVLKDVFGDYELPLLAARMSDETSALRSVIVSTPDAEYKVNGSGYATLLRWTNCKGSGRSFTRLKRTLSSTSPINRAVILAERRDRHSLETRAREFRVRSKSMRMAYLYTRHADAS